MVEISMSGSGEGPVWATGRGYSTIRFACIYDSMFYDFSIEQEPRADLIPWLYPVNSGPRHQ